MKMAVNTRFLLDGALEGVGWYTFEVMRRLVASMPEHEFYFFFDRGYDQKFIFEKNVTPVVLRPPSRHPILWYLWFEYAVPRALKKYDIDLFISTDGFCSLSTDVRQIMVVHDIAFEHFTDNVDFIKHRYFKKYAPKYCSKADHIVTVSEFSKDDLVNLYKIDSNKITVAHNGVSNAFYPVDEEKRDRMIQEFGGDYFLCVGALHPRKNVGRLLSAFDQFKKESKSDYKLVIVGRKAWGNREMESVYERMTFKSDVIFKGHADQELLNVIYASAKALIYPSLFEGFGLPVLEAMKCETAVVTSKNSSMSEICKEAAMYIDPYDINEISTAMRSILEPTTREKLIKQGKTESDKFSWNKTADILKVVVNQVAEQ